MKRALIITTIPDSFKELKEALNKRHWKVIVCDEQEIAIQKISELRPIVIFLPEESGKINGFEILNEIQANLLESLIFFSLKEKSYQNVLKALEYKVNKILDTIETEKILQDCEEFYNQVNLEITQKNIEEQKEDIIRERYSNMYWKESMLVKSNTAMSLNLVRTLRNYFAQANIGALISIINVIKEAYAPDEKGGYYIDSEMINEIFKNSDIGAKVLESLNQYVNLVSDKSKIENFTIIDFFKLLYQITDDIRKLAKKKNITFIKAGSLFINQNTIMPMDIEQMKVVMKELLVNAAKFSRSGDKIYVIPISTSNKIGFQIINPAYNYLKAITGIPEEYQKKVFEPFFRMVEYADPFFFEQEVTSGLGLGLTLAKSVIEKNGGGISISNILDYVGNKDKPIIKVMVEVSFIRE